MRFIDEFIASGGRWSHQSFLTGGTFTASVSGVHFLCGCAGGAAGRIGDDSADRPGGGGGESVDMFPVWLNKGDTVTVTIAAGGTGDGGAGGNTSFGSYLILRGGGYPSASHNYYGGGYLDADGTAFQSTYANAFAAADKKPGAQGKNSASSLGASTQANFLNGVKAGTYMWGGAGGKYGPGAAGSTGAGIAAGDNTGAGGGACVSGTSPGGSGRLDVYWQE